MHNNIIYDHDIDIQLSSATVTEILKLTFNYGIEFYTIKLILK